VILGLILVGVAVGIRGGIRSRHVRGRLVMSATVFALYAAVAALRDYALLSAQFSAQLALVQPLLLAFGAINAFVALAVNPWRYDRVPDRFPTIVQDAGTIALFAIAAAVVLQEKIFAATAVGAVVVGLALQDTLGNLFAGLAIQIEKPFRVGHWVNIAGKDGIVTEITWRATKIRTKHGNLVVLPNNVLARDTITNYSQPLSDTRLDVDVSASYDTPPNDVKAAILETLAHERLISRPDQTEVQILDFGAYAVTYRIRVWIRDFAALEQAQDRVRSLVYYVFRRRNITIPYPIEMQIKHRFPSIVIDRAALAAAVDSVEIFDALSEDQRMALTAAARTLRYAAEEVIVHQGEAGSSMFIVVSGEAVVTLDPAHQEVARLRSGGFFGEMSLLTGEARTATVTAVADCEVVEITADAFRQFVLQNPAALEQVGAAVAARGARLADLRLASGAPAVGSEAPSTFLASVRRFLGLTSVS
jgi:small-conductance mechanosensitive channel/CRP-like cAMP-binding protein